ncbi:MAG: AraC family transcriptional regulator [Spirochaetaceae bacterium]|jgi:AraC-like DNA-binding protein|nr:AraC family transcriptional regulator [Spirochaetaceae bacterium]
MYGAYSGTGIVSRTIAYIEAHLSEKPDLTAIAKGVYYSKYHLHRLFVQTLGMTIHGYTQRRKITEAAKRLVFSDDPIIDISLCAGFESQQAFSSLFKALYKAPPNQFRKTARFYPLQLRMGLQGDGSLQSSLPRSLTGNTASRWETAFAEQTDIPRWMELVRLAIDGFPCLYETDYIQTIEEYIR